MPQPQADRLERRYLADGDVRIEEYRVVGREHDVRIGDEVQAAAGTTPLMAAITGQSICAPGKNRSSSRTSTGASERSRESSDIGTGTEPGLCSSQATHLTSSFERCHSIARAAR